MRCLTGVNTKPVSNLWRRLEDLFGIGCDLSAEAVRLLCSKETGWRKLEKGMLVNTKTYIRPYKVYIYI